MQKLNILYFNSPKYDVITALHIEGLLKIPEISTYFTNTGNYAPKERVLSKDEIIGFGEKLADIVILGSRTEPQPNVDIDTFNTLKKKKQIFIKMEGGDEASLDCSVRAFYKFDKIFKREIFEKDWSFNAFRYSFFGGYSGLWKPLRAHKLFPFPYFHSLANKQNIFLHIRNIFRNLAFLTKTDKVLPFPMGIEERFIGDFNPNPEHTLSCLMRSHSDERKEIMKFLRARYGDKVYTDLIQPKSEDILWMLNRGAFSQEYFNSQDEKDFHSLGIGSAQNIEYYEMLNNSRASLALPGGGFDTLRSWETLAQGSLLIAKRSTLDYPNKLIDRKHYLGFDSYDELVEIIDWVFENPIIVDSIRKRGQEYAIEHHSSSARAKYFIHSLLK